MEPPRQLRLHFSQPRWWHFLSLSLYLSPYAFFAIFILSPSLSLFRFLILTSLCSSLKVSLYSSSMYKLLCHSSYLFISFSLYLSITHHWTLLFFPALPKSRFCIFPSPTLSVSFPLSKSVIVLILSFSFCILPLPLSLSLSLSLSLCSFPTSFEHSCFLFWSPSTYFVFPFLFLAPFLSSNFHILSTSSWYFMNFTLHIVLPLSLYLHSSSFLPTTFFHRVDICPSLSVLSSSL